MLENEKYLKNYMLVFIDMNNEDLQYRQKYYKNINSDRACLQLIFNYIISNLKFTNLVTNDYICLLESLEFSIELEWITNS